MDLLIFIGVLVVVVGVFYTMLDKLIEAYFEAKTKMYITVFEEVVKMLLVKEDEEGREDRGGKNRERSMF